MKANTSIIDQLLNSLHKYASDYDKYEYGLPIHFVDSDDELNDLRFIVHEWLTSLSNTKFEYIIATNDQTRPDCMSLTDFLNRLGDDGWELVDYQMQGSIQSMIFKREKWNHEQQRNKKS